MEASQPFIDESNHELVVTVPDKPIFLDADPGRLAQIISNLLNNAAKYTPTGGRIALTVAESGNEAVIAVRDNGIGIPLEMQASIFEMFVQIDRSMEKSSTGLGVGLTLVLNLVQMHGGTIEVHSEGENLGSEFQVRLPLLESAVDDPGAIVSEGEPIQGSKPKVLVVDDNKSAARLLTILVEKLGGEVRTASDGEEAVAMAAEFLPDLVLMDLGMPKMSGYEAARRIRQQPGGKRMTIAALTGWGKEEDRMRTQEAGFDCHLIKPAEPAELQKLLRAASIDT